VGVQVLREGMDHLIICRGETDTRRAWPEGTCRLPEEKGTWDTEPQKDSLGQGREETLYGYAQKLLLSHLPTHSDSQGP
jgi:hypothetical protein